MKKKNLLLFFIVPLLGIIVIFFALSSVNRRYIREKVEDLVKEQLQATAEILKVNISHYLEENYTSDQIFELLSGEENIYFMALFDDKKEVLGWRSRFEGYLPLSLQSPEKKESWIIDSPIGQIFNSFSSFTTADGNIYHLYLGYSLKNLEEMITHSRRSFYIIFGVILVITLIFFIGVFRLQNYFLEKSREAEEEKKEKMRYREISAFTSGVAHEIKNPLNRLSLLFELLQKRIPKELGDDVLTGKKEVQNISRTIDLFSDFLKPLKLKKEKFLLSELISEMKESLIRESRKIGVGIKYKQEKPVSLMADKGLLSQALVNLIKNSLEATDKGDIVIESKPHKERVFITIKDSGKGIPVEDQKHIFNPFFSQKRDGMGIGLFLTRKIIEAHEGTIDFQSVVGQGTTFFIQIPGD